MENQHSDRQTKPSQSSERFTAIWVNTDFRGFLSNLLFCVFQQRRTNTQQLAAGDRAGSFEPGGVKFPRNAEQAALLSKRKLEC